MSVNLHNWSEALKQAYPETGLPNCSDHKIICVEVEKGAISVVTADEWAKEDPIRLQKVPLKRILDISTQFFNLKTAKDNFFSKPTVLTKIRQIIEQIGNEFAANSDNKDEIVNKFKNLQSGYGALVSVFSTLKKIAYRIENKRDPEAIHFLVEKPVTFAAKTAAAFRKLAFRVWKWLCSPRPLIQRMSDSIPENMDRMLIKNCIDRKIIETYNAPIKDKTLHQYRIEIILDEYNDEIAKPEYHARFDMIAKWEDLKKNVFLGSDGQV